ncbi:MAG: hypothetical protein ABIN97_03740 [Ginsengibacter sp.]
MNNFLRTIIAGWGAKKLGGGCLSTILIFIIIYYALGNCNSRSAQPRRAEVHPTHMSISVYEENKRA